MLFLEYPKCTTCKKAKKWLDDNGFDYIDRDIKLENPSYDELKEIYEKSNLDIKKFFNTSGMIYRELGLKDKLPTMSLDKKLELLATDGMLIKRPLLVKDNVVLTGFKEKEWEEKLKA